MNSDKPKIRFFSNSAGENIAYAVHGEGPPLVVPAWWVSHLELDWQGALYRDFFIALGKHHTVIRYDRPGVGLSDRDRASFTLEDEANNLGELIDALALETSSLLGISCGAPPALIYAQRNPQRIAKLVFFGSFTQGDDITKDANLREAMCSLVAAHWGLGSKTILDLFDPSLNAEQRIGFSKVHRESSNPAMAADLLKLTFNMDAQAASKKVLTPSLVLHRQHDGTVPKDAGRRLAAMLPNAEFRLVDGRAHLPWSEADAVSIAADIIEFTLGLTNPPSKSLGERNQFQQLGDVWSLTYEAKTVHVKDSLGIQDIATLIAHRGKEVSAHFLVSGEDSTVNESSIEMLDMQAMGEYRERLAELVEEKSEAAAAGHESQYEQLENEEEAILNALNSSLGLAGKPRNFSNAQEKARKAISARVRASIKRINAVHPRLGEHLKNSVSTGVLCSYASPENLDWKMS